MNKRLIDIRVTGNTEGVIRHNHITNQILERGKCPACDQIHAFYRS